MKLSFKILASFLIACLLIPVTDADAARKKKKYRARSYQITANSAILINADTNKIYYQRDIAQRVFPASTTKVLTALLVMEKLDLNTYVMVSPKASAQQPSSIGAQVGEQFKVRDLLYALLLKSANDAAVVLAEAVAGSEAAFVAMMNNRARQLGAKNSLFANPNGLPAKHKTQYTTAYDMAIIYKKALQNPFIESAIKLQYKKIHSKGGRSIFLKSHNKGLFFGWKQSIYGKTGYTRQAKSCFVGHVRKGKNKYIIAVFGCRKRWDDVKFIIERFGKIDL